MRKALFVVPIVLAVVGLAGGILWAGEDEHKHGEMKPGMLTVHGEVLDMACYVSHEAKGPDHAECAKRCVKGGQPMGLLAKDGTVYLLYADHADPAAYNAAKEFAGKTVKVTGKSASQAGINGIEVQSVESM